MQENLQQLRFLETSDIVGIISDCEAILRERGALKEYRKNKKRLIKKARDVINVIPEKTKTGEYPIFTKKSESCLINILKDDWSYLFKGVYSNQNDYYVYYHTNPNFKNNIFKLGKEEISFYGKPFYVGRGKGNRFKSKKRNRVHVNKINDIISKGFLEDDIFKIFQAGLTEIQAIELESKLITFFGCSNELLPKKHLHSDYGGWLINTDFGRRPECIDKKLNKR